MALFKSNYKITQAFGVNKDYYSQFGLAGHEGIDLIPTGQEWAVGALADGIVVKDDDFAGSPKSDAYGIFVTVWHPALNKATQYCHLASNIVSLNQQVTKGQKLGTMGASGNTNGAHVHLNLFETNNDGVRLNSNNGFFGGINPEPFLKEQAGTSTGNMYKGYDLTNQESMKVAVDILVRVQAGEFVDKPVYEKLQAELKKAEETRDNLNQQINDRNNDIIQLNGKLSTAESQVLELTERVNSLEPQAKLVPGLKVENEAQAEKIGDLRKEVTAITAQKTRAENLLADLKKNSLKALVAHIMDLVTSIGGK